MFKTIAECIDAYHNQDRRAWNRFNMWMQIFHSIREAFNAEQITEDEYAELLNMLGTD